MLIPAVAAHGILPVRLELVSRVRVGTGLTAVGAIAAVRPTIFWFRVGAYVRRPVLAAVEPLGHPIPTRTHVVAVVGVVEVVEVVEVSVVVVGALVVEVVVAVVVVVVAAAVVVVVAVAVAVAVVVVVVVLLGEE